MKVFAYWAARTGVFLACVALMWAIGWWDLLAVIAAFVLAWLVSYLALPRMRREAAVQMDGWIARTQAKHHTDDADEDAESYGSAR